MAGATPPPSAVCPGSGVGGSPSIRSSVSRVKLSTRGQGPTFLPPSGSSEAPLTGCCLTAFLSFKVKTNSIYPFASR